MPDGTAAGRGSLRRNALANVAGRSASTVLWVVVTPFALARLGPERFAVWSLFFLFGGYVGTLDFGMANGVARYVALATAHRDRGNLLLVLRRSLTLSAVLGGVWCLLCLVFRHAMLDWFHVPPALAPEVLAGFAVFACSMLVYQVTQVLNGALIGFQRLDFANLCFTSGVAVHTAVLVGGLALGGGLIAAAAAMVFGHIVNGTLAALFVRRAIRTTPDDGPRPPATWRGLLHFGGAVQVTTALAVGQIQVGKILLGTLGSLLWVTRFELGFRVANAVWSLPQLIQGAVIPAAAHASAEAGVERVRGVYDWACRWVFALAGFVLAGLWLLAPSLIVLWLGPGHGDSIEVTRGLAIALAVGTVFGPATAVARGGGWPLLETMAFVIAFTLNLVAQWLLIPRFGPAGVALGFGIAYAVAGAWLVVMLHRRLGVPTPRWVVRTMLPRFVLPGVAAALLAWWWPGQAPETKHAALPAFLVQGACFTVLALLFALPTGDPAALLARLRASRGAAAPPLGAEGAAP